MMTKRAPSTMNKTITTTRRRKVSRKTKRRMTRRQGNLWRIRTV
jgi:hypothetical protein